MIRGSGRTEGNSHAFIQAHRTLTAVSTRDTSHQSWTVFIYDMPSSRLFCTYHTHHHPHSLDKSISGAVLSTRHRERILMCILRASCEDSPSFNTLMSSSISKKMFLCSSAVGDDYKHPISTRTWTQASPAWPGRRAPPSGEPLEPRAPPPRRPSSRNRRSSCQ